MLLLVGGLVAAGLVAFILRARVPGGVNDAPLGWVSERWLAEYRSSHPT